MHTIAKKCPTVSRGGTHSSVRAVVSWQIRWNISVRNCVVSVGQQSWKYDLYFIMMALRKIGRMFSTLKFRHGNWMIPHPEKKDKGGEDAWMAREDLLAVADGVGGWI